MKTIQSPIEVPPVATTQTEETIKQQSQHIQEGQIMSTQSSAGSSEKVKPILMPQAGQSMEEGTIISWKVTEGDHVEVGQILMEIETDKATVDVEADNAGRIARIVANEGDVVEVKKPVAYIAENDADVDAYLDGAQAKSSAEPVKPEPTGVSTTPESVQVEPAPAAGPAVSEVDVVVRPVSKMRRAIAKNLSYSKQTIPHFYAKKTIDAGALFATYRKTKERFKCSVNDFVTMACAKAIREYPAFRSQYKNTEVHENPSVNIGIAVGTDDGLTVPVVLNADRMSLEQLAAQSRQVVESARNGKLEGFGQGVFTVTNLGMFGVEEFLPIINPPESAILAVGAIVEGVKVKDSRIIPTRLMTLTLSVDHRIIDGVLTAYFLNTLQELLEAPEQLIS